MNVYVAAKFQEKPRVRYTYDMLRSQGHVVTHDWTKEDEADRKGDELTSYLRQCAKADLDGVVNADVILLYPHARGQGLYVELGIALALGKRVIVIGELTSCIFLQLCEHVPDLQAALKLLVH